MEQSWLVAAGNMQEAPEVLDTGQVPETHAAGAHVWVPAAQSYEHAVWPWYKMVCRAAVVAVVLHTCDFDGLEQHETCVVDLLAVVEVNSQVAAAAAASVDADGAGREIEEATAVAAAALAAAAAAAVAAAASIKLPQGQVVAVPCPLLHQVCSSVLACDLCLMLLNVVAGNQECYLPQTHQVLCYLLCCCWLWLQQAPHEAACCLEELPCYHSVAKFLRYCCLPSGVRCCRPGMYQPLWAPAWLFDLAGHDFDPPQPIHLGCLAVSACEDCLL